MPIIEDRTEEQITREYPRRDYDSGDYLIRDRDRRGQARQAEPHARAVIAANSSIKATGGIVVAVLAILALVGVIPAVLMAIAGIVFGVAMLFEGIGITAEYRKLARWLAETNSERIELAGATGVEFAVGVAAIVLGILALVGIAPATLIPVLVIAGGAGLMLASGTVHRLTDLQLMSMGASDIGRTLRHESMAGAVIAQTLCGLAAVVLGILSLIWGGATATGYGLLSQIGMICLGVGAAIGAGAIAGRWMTHARRS
ncbi:MAG: hypothetical protein ACTHOI_10990 [Sphingomicrobium sp.]